MHSSLLIVSSILFQLFLLLVFKNVPPQRLINGKPALAHWIGGVDTRLAGCKVLATAVCLYVNRHGFQCL